ncbi:MAG: UDP-N-acetylglucosamine 4,6-dehydratase (inverting) [Alphaproteobacteria bacterium]
MDPSWQWFDGKAVLVTGGTGSFGRHFVRTLLKVARPKRLIVFSRDEMKQYDMEREMAPDDAGGALRFFLGDVRDRDRLELAFRGIDLVIHAAALKQVPTAEYNPFECINTNVLGAENVVNAVLRCSVPRVIALSTDKAVSPINLYGASKLAADKIFVAANNLSGGTAQFSVVRYGNVMGSRGSVIPLFLKLIAEKADSLPITDVRMTRFWITLPQVAAFIAKSVAMMQGGEIFVPKIPSMRIVDLAKALAPHLPHRIIGIRPGEKLHEVMITEDDARNTIELADRYIIEPAFTFWTREPYSCNGAKPVQEGFRYSSDGNSEWLTARDMQRSVAGM